jgi:predicted Zn-dependent protease
MRPTDHATAAAQRSARGSSAFLIVTLAVLLVAPVQAAPGTGWVRFRHPSYGFTINYPQGWEVLSGEGTAAFVAIGPAVAGVAGARLGLVVVTARVPQNATLDAAAADLQRQLERSAGAMQILRTDRFDHRGIPALMTYVVRKTPQGIEQYAILMILTTGGRGYAVLGTTATGSARLADETTLLQRAMLTFQPK